MHVQPQTFRFLDLPREIRDEIYDHTLCPFHPHNSRYAIERYMKCCISGYFDDHWIIGNINLLLANKQIYKEGSELMLRTNPFVLIQCRDFCFDHYFRGQAIHAPILFRGVSPAYAQAYAGPRICRSPWFVLRIEIRMGRSERQHIEDQDYIVLWKDLGKIFESLEVESIVLENGQEPFKMVAELGSTSGTTEDKLVQFGPNTQIFTRSRQRQLLLPMRRELRGVHNLEITGCIEEDIAREVTEQVARPRWSNWEALLTEFDVCDRESGAEYLRGDFRKCAAICLVGFDALDRFNRNFLGLTKSQDNTQDFLNRLGECLFNVHFRFANCILRDSTPCWDEVRHGYCKGQTIQTISIRCYHPGYWFFGWSPTNHQKAEAICMAARGLHWKTEYDCGNDVPLAGPQVIEYINKATELWPDNEFFENEKRVLELWAEDVSKFSNWWNSDAPTQEERLFLSLSQWRTSKLGS